MSMRGTHVPAKTTQAYTYGGCIFFYLITAKESGGSSSTMEIFVPPGIGPNQHIHDNEEEQFFILEGEITFNVDGETIQTSPGDIIHIPRGTSHGFKNGPTPARLLATFAPGGIEQLFIEDSDPIELKEGEDIFTSLSKEPD